MELAPGTTAAYRVRALGAVETFPSAPSHALTVTTPDLLGIHGGGGCSLARPGSGSGTGLWPLCLLAGMLVLRKRRKLIQT